MNVNIPPFMPSHGRPDQVGNTAAGGPTPTQQAPAPEDPAVVVDISTTETEPADTPQGPGKSAMSPAHRAKAMLAEAGIQSFDDATVKLGQVVSALARGLDVSTLLSPAVSDEVSADEVPADTGETDTGLLVDDGTADETVPAVEEEDPAIVIEDPAVVIEEPVEVEETVVAEEPAPEESVIDDVVEEIAVSEVDTDGMLLEGLEENTNDQA